MKFIIAMVQPHKLEEVKQALFDANICKLTVTDAWGCGQQAGYSENYRGVKYTANLLKKVRLEIAVNEEFVKPTIDTIIKAARTGSIGDGKIFIMELLDCIRIRTGETGSVAIG